MAKRKKQKIEIKKKQYKLYCHECKEIIESDNIIEDCSNKCGIYILTNHREMTSIYIVN